MLIKGNFHTSLAPPLRISTLKRRCDVKPSGRIKKKKKKKSNRTSPGSAPAHKPAGLRQNRGRPRRAGLAGGCEGVSGRACWCVAVEPWSCGAVSRPAEETLARGGVSGFPQVHFDSCEEAGGSSSWRHSWLRPPRRDPRPRHGTARPGTAGGSGAAGERGGRSAWGRRGLMKHLMCITAGQGETRSPLPSQRGTSHHLLRIFLRRPVLCVCPPHPAPATGQKAAARAGWGGCKGDALPTV